MDEIQKFTLTFSVDDSGNVDIDGKKYSILDIFKSYDHLLKYTYGTHVKKQYMYLPNEGIKEKDVFGRWNKVNLDPRIIKWRTVKVNKEFITGQDLEEVLLGTKGAVDYKMHPHYIEIFGTDDEGNDKLIKRLQIDNETGKLK